jgi:ribosomal protein L12E/L44/L45/RPP1/RPP2
MGGMAAMFAKSLAAPAPLGTRRAGNISSTDSKEKEDEDEDEDEEDERAIFLVCRRRTRR